MANKSLSILWRYLLLSGIAALLLVFPEKCASGVRLGLHIVLYSLLPAILPFMIFSNYVLSSGDSVLISRLIHPLFKLLFKTSQNGSYALIVGLLCGYPMGAKVTADLLKSEKISLKEAQYLFSFVNNPSPAFLSGFLFPLIVWKDFSTCHLLILFYLPVLIVGLVNRNHDFTGENQLPSKETEYPFSKLMDDSIINAFLTLTKLTGYILLFSVLTTFISDNPVLPVTIKILLCGLFEMTTGIQCLIASPGICKEIKLLLAVLIVHFGGISVLCQVNSVIQNSRLSIRLYLKYKLIVLLLCIILFLCLTALSHADYNLTAIM